MNHNKNKLATILKPQLNIITVNFMMFKSTHMISLESWLQYEVQEHLPARQLPEKHEGPLKPALFL